MSKIDIASNYAKALYDTCKEASTGEKTLLQLGALKKAVEGLSQDVFFTEEDAAKFVEKFPFEKELKQVLKMMATNNRFAIMPLLYEEFQSLLDQDMNVIRGTVTSADTLTGEQKTIIESYVNKMTKKKAILNYKEDASILGGFIVDVGTMKMDGSLQYQLDNMKNQIINHGVH